MNSYELRIELEKYHRESYGWALSCCSRNPTEAENVLQAVYLKVLEGKASFDGRAAFEATALPHSKSIYNFASRLTRAEDAADLVQETYLRAYRTFSNFRPGTNCKAWLFTIMYSIFVNKYRKEQRHPEPVSIDESEEAYQQALSAWDPIQPPPIGTEVTRALDQLPENFRLAVLLVDVEEMSYEEAAVVMNCPVGTMRSRLFRARKLLFTELQAYALQQGYAKKSHG